MTADREFVLIRLYRLGDVLMASALACAWKREQPTHVTWIVSEECAALLGGQPYIDRMIVVPNAFVYDYKTRTVVDADRNEERFPLQEARDQYPQLFDALPDRADRVVNLQFNAAAAMIAGQIPTPERSGPYSGPNGEKRVDDLWSQYYLATGADARFPVVHWADAFTNIGGVPRTDVATEFHVRGNTASSRLVSDEIGERPFVVAQIGAYEEQKRWPEAHFREAMIRISRETGRAVVLVGGPKERVLCLRMAGNLIDAGLRVACLAGRTTFNELACVLLACDGLLSNDTFTQHLAAALDMKPVTVFQGDTSPWLTLGYRNGSRAITERGGAPPSVGRVVGAFLRTRTDHLVARRHRSYQFPMPAGPSARTNRWVRRWIIGLGHLRALDPSMTLGQRMKIGFPRDWLVCLDEACATIDRGEHVDPSEIERRLMQSRHPMMTLGIMVIAKLRYSSAGDSLAERRTTYAWLAEALKRAGEPE